MKDNQMKQAEREAFEKLITPVIANIAVSDKKYSYGIASILTAYDLMQAKLTTSQVSEPVVLNNMSNTPEQVQAYIRQSMPNISKELVALITSPNIDEIVSRFLGWKLPSDFSPDAGISFNKLPHLHDSHEWPTGTNLLNAEQAKDMFKHVLAGCTVELMPTTTPQEAISPAIAEYKTYIETLESSLVQIALKCRSNEWGTDTPRKEILNWFHDYASATLASKPTALE